MAGLEAVIMYPGIYGGPWWFHHHGMKMYLAEKRSHGALTTIRNNAASIEIHRHLSVEHGFEGWDIRWAVRFSMYEEAAGNCVFSDEDLACAFGLKDNYEKEGSQKHSAWMVSQYGGTVGHQGRFLRSGNYLVVPAPGMNHDGVAAVSIELDSNITNAIRTLLHVK